MLTKKEFKEGKVELKDGVLLLNNRYGLMYIDEEEQIKKQVRDLCKKHKPKKVLEIGFGLGYTATEFQNFGLEKHVIVEAHPEIYKDALDWKKDNFPKNNIKIINKFVQDYNYNKKDFNLIYDDRMELVYDVKNGTIFPNYSLPQKSG